MSTSAVIDQVNQRTMSTVVRHSGWRDDLHVSERAALETIVEAVRGRRILDLGVGAGRTVEGAARAERGLRLPTPRSISWSFRATASAWSITPAGCASSAKWRRLLAPGGHFVFSTSNRNDPNAGRFRLPGFRLTFHPIKLAVRCWRFLLNSTASVVNRLRLKPTEVHTSDYAILNDRSHDFGTMNYFITLEKQLAQLREHGFHDEPQVFDEHGCPIVDDTTHGTMTFVVRKPIEQIA
jgi:hypothetical protein